jgi:hypothetical protein
MSRAKSFDVVQPRAVLYGRVSAVMGRGDELTSPELQEHVVRSYGERPGYAPGAVVVRRRYDWSLLVAAVSGAGRQDD